MSVPKMKAQSNLAWARQVWANASDDFKARIPLPTQDTLKEFGTTVLSLPELLNEFTQTYMRIGRVYVDRFRAYDPLELFIGETIDFGGIVQTLYVDVAQGYQFDPTGSHAFKKADNDIKSEYMIEDCNITYKVTISYEQARTAFTSEGQMQSLFDAIVSQLYEARRHDLYVMLKQIIAAYQGYGEPVVIKDIVPGSATAEADAKAAVLQLKLATNKLRFSSRKWNNRGVMTNTPPEELVFIIRYDYEAYMSVEYLAGVFNMSETEIEARRIVVDDFGGAMTVPFLVLDRRAVQVHLYPEYARTEFNADGGFYNYYTNCRGIICMARFRNAVMFTTVAPAVISLDANGGTGEQKPIYVPYVAGQTSITVPPNEFTPPDGKMFAGWGNTAAATSPTWLPGQTYQLSSGDPVTMYALWGNVTVG